MQTLSLAPAAASLTPLPGQGWPATGDAAAAADCYCPRDCLASFTLLMAGHGRCVHAAMMLGDREYALWQLACARALDDPELAAVTSRLQAYFGDAQALPVLGTA